MDEKLKIFWNLDVLVKMCRSKSDGPSLRVEEEEILEKISANEQEIEDVKTALEEDTYDMSAEMADRNIEIITKKQLQSLKSELKDKNKYLNKLKDLEKTLYNQTSLLRENKASNEKYIASMQERLSENTDRDVLDRYNALITETLIKVNELSEELKEENTSYENVQNDILQASADVEDLEERIEKKKRLLAETQANLENKDNYVDKTKREKNNKKIAEITERTRELEERLEEIRKDPKYIETKIKDVINSKEEPSNARDYLSALVKIVIDQPYINVPTDNALEEELLRATQARDSFANEIDQKSYNILEATTPEKIRTDFLNKRIAAWKKELDRLQDEIDKVDKDNEFNYEENDRLITEMIKGLKSDLKEFQRAYDETPDSNIGLKASLEVALEEKQEDIIEAEKIANSFKTNEAEDIANATRTIKYQCEQLNNNIEQAEEEIKRIRNRLMSKKSGLIDIATRNKDKDVLKDLAQTVIDIKHRRQFPETPLEIVTRLEQDLDIKILEPEDMEKIAETSVIQKKNYDEFIEKKLEPAEEEEQDEFREEATLIPEDREISEAQIMNPEELLDNSSDEELQKLADQAMANEVEQEPIEPQGEEAPAEPIEEPVPETPFAEEIPADEPVAEEAPVEEQPAEAEPIAEAPAEEVPVEEPVAEEAPVEEQPTEEAPAEEMPPVEETPAEEPAPETEAIEGAPVEEQPTMEPTEEPPVAEPTEEAPVEDIQPAEEIPVEEPVAEEAPVEETPTEEAQVEEQPAEPVEEKSEEELAIERELAEITGELDDNPFGEAINPLENETPTEEAPAEDVIELANPTNDEDFSINSMFSNSIELHEPKNNEDVRNNLSNELDNFVNNIDENNN